MSWLSSVRNALSFVVPAKKETPDNLWHKCKGCGTMVFTKEWEENLSVCPSCDHHGRIGPAERFAQLLAVFKAKKPAPGQYPPLLQFICELHDDIEQLAPPTDGGEAGASDDAVVLFGPWAGAMLAIERDGDQHFALVVVNVSTQQQGGTQYHPVEPSQRASASNDSDWERPSGVPDHSTGTHVKRFLQMKLAQGT